MAIDDCHQVRPGVTAAVGECQVHRSAYVSRRSDIPSLSRSRPRGSQSVEHEPPLALENAVNPSTVDVCALLAQHGPPQPVTKDRMFRNQRLDPSGQAIIERSVPPTLSPCLADRGLSRSKHPADPAHRVAGKRVLYSLDLAGSVGRYGFCASLSMSMSFTSPPIHRLSFLTCSSLRVSSCFGRERSEFSCPSSAHSLQSPISATVRPCGRAAYATLVLPFMMLNTRAALRLIVGR